MNNKQMGEAIRQKRIENLDRAHDHSCYVRNIQKMDECLKWYNNEGGVRPYEERFDKEAHHAHKAFTQERTERIRAQFAKEEEGYFREMKAKQRAKPREEQRIPSIYSPML
eukprot:Platyproteum_vivax@DN17451_c0_g1_i1.p1